MNDKVFTPLGASNHTTSERANEDYYATDPIAIDKLASKHKLSGNYWECACGQMHLVNKLYHYGFVYASDLVVRPNQFNFECHQLDFLNATKNDVPFDGKCNIITNPPYNQALDFVLKSLELLEDGYECIMFLRLQFLEGQKRYKMLLSKYPPKKVLVSVNRIQCFANGNFDIPKGSAIAYAWFIWEKGYKGETTIDWI